MPNKAPQTDLLKKILAQFKCNCEVIHELKLMLAAYENHPPKQQFPYTEGRDRAFLAYLPGYTLLIYDGKLMMFYSLSTSTVYDISQLLNIPNSGYYNRRLKADTGATKIKQYRRI